MFAKQAGAEMMLRAAGLGGVLDAANSLASSGAINHILAFADQLPALLERLEGIENELRELRAVIDDAGAIGNAAHDAGASARKPRSRANGAGDPASAGPRGSLGAPARGAETEGAQ